ncbi:MAG: hypothetical protein N2554_04115, partial [Fimbriimonadales bacterium]|nr:hypothetical protein [Fimbriimonadales bacterium]
LREYSDEILAPVLNRCAKHRHAIHPVFGFALAGVVPANLKGRKPRAFVPHKPLIDELLLSLGQRDSKSGIFDKAL